MNGNLNLSELEKELDEVLSKETSETLTNWLLTKRKTNNMDIDLFKKENYKQKFDLFNKVKYKKRTFKSL